MMQDRRLRPANQRVALQGHGITDPKLATVAGEAAQIAVPLVNLQATPDGAIDRQLRRGAAVIMVERHNEWAFVRHEADSYVGYVPASALHAPQDLTHRIYNLGTHVYAAPKVQAPCQALPLDARVRVQDMHNNWAETDMGFIPASHLLPLDTPATDPISEAERLLGVPYLWGGNSQLGIDCSGLVQMAMGLCAIDCPADADLQQAAFGHDLPNNEPLQRGDLLFWRGHVAMMHSANTIIHANGYSMNVAIEPLDSALARIAQAEYGELTARKRYVAP